MNISPNIYAVPDALTPCAGVGASCLAHDLDPDPDPRPSLPSLASFPYVNVLRSRWTTWNLQLGNSLELGCLELGAFTSPSPRLTAPNRGKTRLIELNHAKNFSGGSRASIRGCATGPATAPQDPATTRINLRLLAGLAPTCTEKNFCRFALIGVYSRFNPHIGKSSRIKLTKGKYSQVKPPRILAHNPARNPYLTPSPVAPMVTYGHLWTVIVANCRFPKIA